MKNSIKAALYSGLVFPGVGQFSLRRYLRGMIFFIPSVTSLMFIVNNTMHKALTIVGQIERGEVPLDPEAIAKLIEASSTGGSELMMLNTAQWIIAVCWIISIIDSYRLGNIADQTNRQ